MHIYATFFSVFPYPLTLSKFFIQLFPIFLDAYLPFSPIESLPLSFVSLSRFPTLKRYCITNRVTVWPFICTMDTNRREILRRICDRRLSLANPVSACLRSRKARIDRLSACIYAQSIARSINESYGSPFKSIRNIHGIVPYRWKTLFENRVLGGVVNAECDLDFFLFYGTCRASGIAQRVRETRVKVTYIITRYFIRKPRTTRFCVHSLPFYFCFCTLVLMRDSNVA